MAVPHSISVGTYAYVGYAPGLLLVFTTSRHDKWTSRLPASHSSDQNKNGGKFITNFVQPQDNH